MTKADLIELISIQTSGDKKEIKAIIESFYKVVQDSMAKKKDVFLRGFGTFKVVKMAEKNARDIGQNKNITVPSHYKPKFKPVKSFVEEVRKNVK